MKLSKTAMFCLIALTVMLVPAVGYCSVESTLGAIQSKLINVILPLAAVLGLVASAFSFFTGNPMPGPICGLRLLEPVSDLAPQVLLLSFTAL